MTAFAFIGAVTSATIVLFGEAIWDPIARIARIGSAPVIIFGALIVLLAQLTTNMAANVVSPANDFSSLAAPHISSVIGGLITAVIGIVMLPWKLYADAAAYSFTWSIGYSSLMGAIGGILIADYPRAPGVPATTSPLPVDLRSLTTTRVAEASLYATPNSRTRLSIS